MRGTWDGHIQNGADVNCGSCSDYRDWVFLTRFSERLAMSLRFEVRNGQQKSLLEKDCVAVFGVDRRPVGEQRELATG
jgi:hypothetical protein